MAVRDHISARDGSPVVRTPASTAEGLGSIPGQRTKIQQAMWGQKCFYNNNKKKHKEIFWGNGYMYYFDCGDSFMGVWVCTKSSNCTYIKYVHQLHLNKVFKNK